MKKLLFALLVLATLSATAQSKPPAEKASPGVSATVPPMQVPGPVALNRSEVDSVKSILGNMSQRIAQIACLSQGDASLLQQFLQIAYNTILRKEKEAAEPPKKQ